MRKQALITAGVKNTGFGIAEYLAKKGMDLHITSRDLESAVTAADILQKKYPDIKVYPYSLELKETANIKKLFKEIRSNVPSLDIFVANAADLGVDYDIYNTDEESYDRVMDTNVKGTFFCCQEAGKMMTENGGSIVLIGSVQSKGAVEGRTLYGISKAAINGMCKYLAYDFAPYNIRVNEIIAGAIHTERWDALDENVAAQRRMNYPLGREADIEEIAEAVYYLSNDNSKHITGVEITIDSGLLLSILPYRDRKLLRRENY